MQVQFLNFNPKLGGRSGHHRILGALMVLAMGASVSIAQPRTATRVQPEESGPPIGFVNILVSDVTDGGDIDLGTLESGDVLTVEPNRKIRFRMQTKTRRNATRGLSYPSTLFSPSRQKASVRSVKVNEEIGSFTFISERRGAGAQRQTVHYEITQSGISITDRLRKGRVFVELAVPKPVQPEPPQVIERRGVTLFQDSGFRGRSERLLYDDPDLRDNQVGNDRLSSIQLDEGCVARIFSDTQYRGDYTEVRFDRGDLSREEVGNDQASSIQVLCEEDVDDRDRGRGRDDRRGGRDADPDRRDDFRRGVTLYSDSDFRGETLFLRDGSYADLDREGFRSDSLSSLAVGRGCIAILYDDSSFRGRSMEVDRDLARLQGTAIGNDRVSSVRVVCR